LKKSTQKILDFPYASLLLESMADGVFTLSPKGEITSWNPSMERITGYGVEEVMGRTCSILDFSRCIRKSCPSGFKECGIFKAGTAAPKECVLRHKEGHDVPVVKNARLVKDEGGSVIGVVETVTDLTELQNARRKAEEAERRLGERFQFDEIIGKSKAMQPVFSAIKAAASSDATVLVHGASGTGKELVAGAVHYHSLRNDMPFVTVNCSALSESLLESELFGHVKGAFTGALRDRIGRFEGAEGGTIFLDEIGDVSPFIQIKLLRVLQELEIERVGDSKKRPVDIRIIAATNRDLYELVRSGHFREDLYYRLKVFPIRIPPLKERREDIPFLVDRFIEIQNKKTRKKIAAVSREAMSVLMNHPWPGNVRELENAIGHAFVLRNEGNIDISDLPVELRHPASQSDSKETPDSQNQAAGRNRLSRETLLQLLDECQWNKAEVGRRVGLSRTAIWKYMNKWEIPLKPPEK
jgi:PAS domain S-box-containing protein